MECRCSGKEALSQPLQKLEELVEAAKGIYKVAGDPISAVIRFLHERPENQSLSGLAISKVLLETFEQESAPQLVNILAGHVSEIVRRRNVIELIKEHPGLEKWGNYVIKQTDRIKFEVAREKDRLVLKDIAGLLCVEHGVELPLDKILINPPKLEITFRLGLLRPQKIVDIA